TAWDAPFGTQEGQWLEAELDAPAAVSGAALTVIADGRHSVPTRVRIEADGQPVTTVDLPPITDLAEEGATVEVPLEFGPVTAQRLRLVFEQARVVAALDDRTLDGVATPIGVAEVGV